MVKPIKDYRFSIIVPVYNGGKLWAACAQAIHDFAPADTQVIIMDSGSTDGSIDTARTFGFHVVDVPTGTFNHGLTRTAALDYLHENTDVAVYITHDAIIRNQDTLINLLSAFDDPAIGMAYGRQLSHKDANPLARHARQFNYPSVPRIKEKQFIPLLGLKSAFASDSFAAYRISALKEVGGFPETICSEDMLVGIEMLQKDYKIAYVASSCVYHSHNYTVGQEFSRYFDIGVSHTDYKHRLQCMGRSEGEGVKFVRSEIRYLRKHKKSSWIPSAITDTIAKYAGYRLGKLYRYLPKKYLPKFSMYKGYWSSIHKQP